MQREAKDRLRQLIAEAVVDVWRRVSGDVTAVAIEGTVCITPEASGTVIVQLDRSFANDKREPLLDRNCNDLSTIDPQTTASDKLAAYMDDMSPASMTSLTVAESDVTSREGGRAGASQLDSGLDSTSQDDTHLSRCREDVKPPLTDAAGQICAGTGYYSTLDARAEDDNHDVTRASRLDEIEALDWSFNERDRTDRCVPMMSTPKRDAKRRPRPDAVKPTALDLSTSRAADVTPRSVADLSLSDPHNYTEQVRDVIRQRILAQAHSFMQHSRGVREEPEVAFATMTEARVARRHSRTTSCASTLKVASRVTPLCARRTPYLTRAVTSAATTAVC